MYCNQCGHEMKDTANFCKKCGAPVDPTEEISERKRKCVRFLYLYKTRILICLIAALLLCGAAIGALALTRGMSGDKDEKTEKPAAAIVKTVKSVDLKDSYKMEDNRLVLDPLHAQYSDGTVQELLDYDVFIDTQQCEIVENAINAEELYDGEHLVRLEWKQDADVFEYEKTVELEHKKDTWEKYPDLVGMTGKAIAKEYGELGSPEFGDFHEGDWGYAYVELSARSLKLCFPAGLINRTEDYSGSDETCIEVSGTLEDFFYNMEDEMSRERLAEILNLNLYDCEEGGCMDTLNSGKRMYIGVGEVKDGVYTPDTTIRVTVSESEEQKIWERIF